MNDINGNPIVLRKQARKYSCGQTSVAMLTGRPVEEIYKAYGTKSVTYTSQTVEVLRNMGVMVGDSVVYTASSTVPAKALVRIARFKRSGGHISTTKVKKLGHLVVLVEGTVFDPSGEQYSFSELNSRGYAVTHFIPVGVDNTPKAM